MKLLLCRLILGLSLGLVFVGKVQAGFYDPLTVDPDFHPTHLDVSFTDAARHREIPLRVYLPRNTKSAAVVLFSHGLGGSREGNVFLGEHWAARGYVAVFVQHPGSDDAIWKEVPPLERMKAMKAAASVDNFLLRVQDVTAVLNQLESWNGEKAHPLAGRLDLSKVGMSGHSFGAITTQAVSGQTMPLSGQKLTDSRIRAAVVFSPGSPQTGSPAEAFGAVKIPWLLMTGTKDVAPVGHQDVASRLAVYPALQGAPKYEVVLFNAEHSVFTDRKLPGDAEPRNPNHHRVILALTTAFWDKYLYGDELAGRWLNSDGPRSVMEKDDRWQFSDKE